VTKPETRLRKLLCDCINDIKYFGFITKADAAVFGERLIHTFSLLTTTVKEIHFLLVM